MPDGVKPGQADFLYLGRPEERHLLDRVRERFRRDLVIVVVIELDHEASPFA
jgi:hypothetical protein